MHRGTGAGFRCPPKTERTWIIDTTRTNESATPDEPPLYIERAQEMGIDELAEFIKDCLDRRHEYDPGGDKPQDKDEFLKVWRLLRQKSDAMLPDSPPPSNALDKARDKWARNYWFLYGGDPRSKNISKKDRRRIERDMERLDREIERMEASEKYDDLPDPEPDTPKRRAARIASEVFWAIENAFELLPQTTGRRLAWRPARPGLLSVESIRRYYEERRRHEPELKFDMGRIEKAKELGPDEPPWEGPDGFDGYVIYTFPGSKKALMECPEIGNAAYVIHKDWEAWSQLDKQELMAEAERGGDVARVPHQGDWHQSIKKELGV